MPTRIDEALSTGNEEIAASISKVEHNPANAAVGVNDRYSSPLFRDELQKHEMQYLDTFLSPETRDGPSNSSSLLDQGGQVNGTLNGDIYTGYPISKIASLMNNFCRDTDLADANANQSTNLRYDTSCDQKENFFDASDENQGSNVANEASITPITQMNAGTKQSTTKAFKDSRIKTDIKCPTPSKSKRSQLNRRFLQKAKITSRNVATKMIKFANRCTRDASVLTNKIRGSVQLAVRKMHIMLEDSKNDHAVRSMARDFGSVWKIANNKGN